MNLKDGTVIRSRRRPHLRVVAVDEVRQRHAVNVNIMGCERLIEIFTFDEWTRLSAVERPSGEGVSSHLIPGIGFMIARKVSGEMERQDVEDIHKQALDRYRAGI